MSRRTLIVSLLAAMSLALVPAAASATTGCYANDHSGRAFVEHTFYVTKGRYDFTTGQSYYFYVPRYDAHGNNSNSNPTIVQGYVAGGSSWHSPDSLLSNHGNPRYSSTWAAWSWHTRASVRGGTRYRFRAIFDIPKKKDPSCDAYTSVF